MPRAKMSDEARKAKRRAARVRREARKAATSDSGRVSTATSPAHKHAFEETTQQTRTTAEGTFAIETCTRPSCTATRSGRKIS